MSIAIKFRYSLVLGAVALASACGSPAPAAASVHTGSGSLARALEVQVPAPPPAAAPPVRIQIPKLNVDAPVEIRSVGPDGVSEAPADPHDVAWYDFSDRPGEPGIALFAGHRDWWGIGPTVFYGLDSLQKGDEITVLGKDGMQHRYRVVQGYLVDPDSRAGDLLAGTPGSIVVYTCDGAFDPLKGEYTRRFVVKADPVQA